MLIARHPGDTDEPSSLEDQAGTCPLESGLEAKPRPPIAILLRRLRGDKTLRRVESETGISNAYLSNLEQGSKRPGAKILAKLAAYHSVSLQELLQVAGLPLDQGITAGTESVIDIQRSYDFVLSDPNLSQYSKPAGTPNFDTQKFVVQMYEHYTGKKLL